MRYANIKNLSIENGPGIRVSLFVSGCRRHCKGCFNEVAQSFEYGTRFGSETLVELLRLLSNPHIKGLSILGGEPLEPENRVTVLDICKAVRVAFGDEKTIWMWTGYSWEDVKDLPVMEYLDVLVDGPFVEEQKNLCLPYCGSENQRVIDVKMSLRGSELVTVPFTSTMKGD